MVVEGGIAGDVNHARKQSARAWPVSASEPNTLYGCGFCVAGLSPRGTSAANHTVATAATRVSA